MPLSLRNEFVVAASIESTWGLLLDLRRVAGCLPGASIEQGPEDNTFVGTMRVKIGPVVMDYRGVARIEEVDESTHVAVFGVKGNEVRGQGTATASIRNTIFEDGTGTRVLVETELTVTGRPAQFGRGIMQDVAASMLDDFAQCLSRMMANDGTTSKDTPALEAAHTVPSDDAIDLTAALGQALRGRVLRWTGLTALGAFVSRVFGRNTPKR